MVSKKEKTVSKLAAKRAKLKAKLGGAPAAVVKAAKLVLIAATLATIVGCQSTPSRAQTQTIRDCTFYVMLPAAPGTVAPTNAPAVAAAEPAAAPAGYVIGDLFTQNQVVENSGSESLAPQHEISPKTDLSYGVGTGGGSTWGELFSGLASLFKGGGTADTDTAAAAASKEAAAGAACADGTCSDK